MGLDRIVCLANSYKHEHRCVAGISLATKEWVRLVGRKVSGCLTMKETCYSNGKQAALLDVFEVELGEPCGSNCHPEDVYVSEKPWQQIRHFSEPRDAQFLASCVTNGPPILQGYGDRIDRSNIDVNPMDKSLELVRPEGLWWWIRDEKGKRRNRALFRLGHVGRIRYDLAVTDPRWLDQLNLLPAGIYPHAFFFKGKPPRTFLTISLGEAFEGFHYKLVAGVVTLPA
jgi:hypothetical protein